MIIYKTTNLVNNKIYIGKACGIRVNNGYLGSGVWIKRAIRKYGKENFKRETIDTASNRREQELKEIHWINVLDARNPLVGYNISLQCGGYVGSPTAETRLKQSRAKIGKQSGRKGKINSQEHNRKIRESLLNRKYRHSEETKEAIRQSNIGLKRSEQARRNNSIAQIKWWEKRRMEATNG